MSWSWAAWRFGDGDGEKSEVADRGPCGATSGVETYFWEDLLGRLLLSLAADQSLQ